MIDSVWTLGGLRGRHMKLLWSGTLNVGGTITIPELPYYNQLLVRFYGGVTTVPMYRNAAYDLGAGFRGANTMATGSDNQEMFAIAFEPIGSTGTQIKLYKAVDINHYKSGNHTAATALTVLDIRGYL